MKLRGTILSAMASRWPSTATNMAFFGSISRVRLGTTSGLTQFGRAMQELDIQIICANTPQAKGRVERANQTLQDRLVKELRLRGISDMEAANAYLPEFREDFNRRFAVQPRSTHDAHRPLLKTENLDLILTHQKTGTLSKNLTVQSNNVIYQIQSDRPDYTLRNAQVTVCENAKGEVTILYKNKPLSYTIFHKPSPPGRSRRHQDPRPSAQAPQATGSRSPLAYLWPPPQRQTHPGDPSQWLRLIWIGSMSLSLLAKNWAE